MSKKNRHEYKSEFTDMMKDLKETATQTDVIEDIELDNLVLEENKKDNFSISTTAWRACRFADLSRMITITDGMVKNVDFFNKIATNLSRHKISFRSYNLRVTPEPTMRDAISAAAAVVIIEDDSETVNSCVKAMLIGRPVVYFPNIEGLYIKVVENCETTIRLNRIMELVSKIASIKSSMAFTKHPHAIRSEIIKKLNVDTSGIGTWKNGSL